MPDRLVRGLLPSQGLRAVHVRVTDTARIARMLHGLYPTTARLFGEAMAAGLLVASLQKDRGRVNLQVECDGPVRGLLVDADPEGNVRGYVRAPLVHFPGDAAAGARAALGGSGFLSVMRDLGGGNFYRGQVELRAMELSKDLGSYFSESEQVATILVQRLPEGDDAALAAARARLASGAFRDAVARGAGAQDAIVAVAGDGFDLLADLEVAYRCGCSLERARVAVSALGRDGILDVLSNEREAVITCEFCRERYVVAEPELRDLARRLAEAQERDG